MAGIQAKLRDKVLRELLTPILFVQGTRDPLCPLDLLEKVRSEMHAPNELHIVEGGDHSLIVTKKQLKITGESQQAIDARILSAIKSSPFLEAGDSARAETMVSTNSP